MIRVFVAEDHAIVQDGLRRVLEGAGGIAFAGATERGHAVLDAVADADWDVLVLDLSLADISGLEVLRQLRDRAPKLPVIVLSMYPEAQYAPRVMKMGARAYLSKTRSSRELVEAIRAVARGKRYITPAVADALLEHVGEGEGPPHARLSEREYQVFQLVVEGLSPGDIAAQLNLSPSTASSHLVHIRTKLGVRTNGEILTYAFRAGLAIDAGSAKTS